MEQEIGEKEVKKEEKSKCLELEKCDLCNKESISKNLCIKCNNQKDYYYLNNNLINSNDEFIDCVNNNTKPSNYYYDKETKEYKLCYESCLTCEYGGDGDEITVLLAIQILF